MDNIVKTCTKCGEVKPLVAFGSNRRSKSGLQAMCKNCVNAKLRERYKTNNLVREKCKEYRDSIKDKTREYNAQYRKNNPEKIRALRSKYRKGIAGKNALKRFRIKHHDAILKKSSEYHAANKDKERAYKTSYYIKNPSARKEQKAKAISELQSGYVASQLAKNTGLSAKLLPPELIKLKRVQLQITRKLKELKKCQT